MPGARVRRSRSQEFAAADRLTEDTAMLYLSGTHLHRMFDRVLQTVHTVVTHGRFVPPNSVHELPEMSVSGEDLRQAELRRGALPPRLRRAQNHHP